MDRDVFVQLQDAGIRYDIQESLPWIDVPPGGAEKPPVDMARVTDGASIALVRLRRASELFAGNEIPPSFLEGPTAEYEAFFMMLELAALDGCDLTGTVPTDEEFEALFDEVRRSPDGPGRHPLFPWLNAAARLYMSLVDTSRAEFDAVLRRLAKSARTWSRGKNSRSYHRMLSHFLEFSKTSEDVRA